MGYKGVCVVAALAVISYRRVLALTCQGCHGRGPNDSYPNGTVIDNCGPKPTCSYGYNDGVCGCGCYDTCNKGPGEPCGGNWGFDGKCGGGLTCMRIGGYWDSTSICVPEAPQACSPPWFRINDQCFLLVGAAYPNKADWRNWASADDYCRSQAPSRALAHPSATPQVSGGAALAQPKPYNVKPLSDYIKSKGYSDSWDTFWLAGSDFNQKVVRRRWWSDGINITTGWQRGEPNSDNGKDCLGIGPMGADSLIDMGCEGVWPFVCEA